jgi:hypothetical protein
VQQTLELHQRKGEKAQSLLKSDTSAAQLPDKTQSLLKSDTSAAQLADSRTRCTTMDLQQVMFCLHINAFRNVLSTSDVLIKLCLPCG